MPSEIDVWYMNEIQPFDQSEAFSVFKLLERYVNDQPVGDPTAFAWMTMSLCTSTAIEIAEKIVVDATASAHYRFSAMSHLILLSNHSENIDYALVIKNLLILACDEAEYEDLIEMILKVLDNRDLWNATKSHVRSALIRLCHELDITTKVPIQNKYSCKNVTLIIANELARRRAILRRRYEQAPEFRDVPQTPE